MLQLFVSYASEDADRARQFTADLRRPGIDAWMDDDLKLAGLWNKEIERRIPGSDLFVLLLSRATQEAKPERFFRREWGLAREAGRRFLPVRLEECRLSASLPSDFVDFIESYQGEDLFPSYEQGLRRILRFLHLEKRTGVFEETFSCLGADNIGWRLIGWDLDDADSTGENSSSIHAVARLDPTKLLGPPVVKIASIDIDLPGRPLLLRYRRRLQLSAPLGGESGFRVTVDGEIVDTASHADPREDDWTSRSVPVPDRGERRAALEFRIAASSNLNYFPSAEAWVDDVRVA
jgi:hypothetical protein